MSLPPGTDLSKIPALEPPPGVIPDFVNPPSLAKTLIIVNVIFMVLMVIFVALRVYSKALVIRAMGWDDCEHFLRLVLYRCDLTSFRYMLDLSSDYSSL